MSLDFDSFFCEQKVKVGFYLENKNIPKVDLSEPRKGNPGCGGTEYTIVTLVYELARRQSAKCTPILFANTVERLPENFDIKQVPNVYDAARSAKEEGCDFFVYRPCLSSEIDVLDLIEKLKLPTVGWAHLTPQSPYLRKMAGTSFFRSLVCLEREQYDLIRDNPVFRKLSCIPHGVDVDNFRLSSLPPKDFNSVVYLGALIPQKGFHLLAKVWLRIVERVPRAKLTIIGTGVLYNRNAKIGKWGVASKEYEEKYIIPYLSDSEGKPHSSVCFTGNLGYEKNEILHKALIGVPNPGGRTETFCMSAVEFQACGTAVVSGKFYSLTDTVNHGVTGLLGKTEDDLINNICYLLNNPNKACEMGRNGERFIRQKYDYQEITREWITLFGKLASNQKLTPMPFKKNIFSHDKWMVIINSFLQKSIGRFFAWPSIYEMKSFVSQRISNIKK